MDHQDLPIDPQLFASTPTNMVTGVTPEHNLPKSNATTQIDTTVYHPNREEFRFICPICGAKRSRRYTIKQHFPGCVRKRGNPKGLEWTDHPSTHGYAPRKASIWNKDRERWYPGVAERISQTNSGQEQGHERYQSLNAQELGVVAQLANLAGATNHESVGSVTGPRYHLGQTVEVGAWNTPYAAPVASEVQVSFVTPDAARWPSRFDPQFNSSYPSFVPHAPTWEPSATQPPYTG